MEYEIPPEIAALIGATDAGPVPQSTVTSADRAKVETSQREYVAQAQSTAELARTSSQKLQGLGETFITKSNEAAALEGAEISRDNDLYMQYSTEVLSLQNQLTALGKETAKETSYLVRNLELANGPEPSFWQKITGNDPRVEALQKVELGKKKISVLTTAGSELSQQADAYKKELERVTPVAVTAAKNAAKSAEIAMQVGAQTTSTVLSAEGQLTEAKGLQARAARSTVDDKMRDFESRLSIYKMGADEKLSRVNLARAALDLESGLLKRSDDLDNRARIEEVEKKVGLPPGAHKMLPEDVFRGLVLQVAGYPVEPPGKITELDQRTASAPITEQLSPLINEYAQTYDNYVRLYTEADKKTISGVKAVGDPEAKKFSETADMASTLADLDHRMQQSLTAPGGRTASLFFKSPFGQEAVKTPFGQAVQKGIAEKTFTGEFDPLVVMDATGAKPSEVIEFMNAFNSFLQTSDGAQHYGVSGKRNSGFLVSSPSFGMFGLTLREPSMQLIRDENDLLRQLEIRRAIQARKRVQQSFEQTPPVNRVY